MTPLLAQRPRADRTFERLYRRHVSDVYHYALAVLRNPTDAEDVTQTTFLNAYRAFERGERPHAPHNWLIAIAHNVCRQRFRQSARRPYEVALDDEAVDIGGDSDAPTAQDIRNALGHLAFNQRAALVMRELEGRSYTEIGEILGLSVSAVETLIFRARRALREQIEGSLTCNQAELAISRQIDGRLPRTDRGALRAHLRECSECAAFARSQRAQRAAFKAIAAVPLPSSLASFFGGGSASVGAGLATKAAVAVTATALVGGVGYEGSRHLPRPLSGTAAHPASHRAVRPVAAPPAVVRSRVAAAPPASHVEAVVPKSRAAGHPARRHHSKSASAKATDQGKGNGDEQSGESASPSASAAAPRTDERGAKGTRRGQKGRFDGESQQSRKADTPKSDHSRRGQGGRSNPGHGDGLDDGHGNGDGQGNGEGQGNGGDDHGNGDSKHGVELPKPPSLTTGVPVPDLPDPGKVGGKN
jgi:RNA polymerase sigma-70 factor (ECF subfamily)